MKKKCHTQYVIRVMILSLLCGVSSTYAKDKCGYQTIHWIVNHDRPEIIELLITKCADVNAKTSLGHTPLELAKLRRNTTSIEVLRKNGTGPGDVLNTSDVVSKKPHVVLERGDVKEMIVNNEPVDNEVLQGHRGGYNGMASLTHCSQNRNPLVPFYAGLNFEHIHDGTTRPRDILFKPRRAPIEIKRADPYTVEFHQPPKPTCSSKAGCCTNCLRTVRLK